MAAHTSPTSTYMTYLMHKGASESAYTKLVDIKDFPNLGGTPETIATTTLSDNMETFVLGVQSLGGALEFTANYTKDKFAQLKAMEGNVEHFAVYFGEGGEDGIFAFDGQLSAFPVGKGVNEVREMTISIAPATVITFQ